MDVPYWFLTLYEPLCPMPLQTISPSSSLHYYSSHLTKETPEGPTNVNTLLKATHKWQSRDSKLHLYAAKPVINHSAMVATIC